MYRIVAQVDEVQVTVRGDFAISASLDRGESGEEIQALGGWTYKDSSGLELGA
jgi:hypothetical protein